MRLKDQINQTHNFENIPQRVVCLVPSISETLVDIGLSEQLVGITRYCIHPANLLEEKTIVGGTKKVVYERVQKLNPDLIIANKEENTAEIVAEMQQITKVWVTDIYNMQDVIQMFEDFGEIFQIDTNFWIQKIHQKTALLQQKLKDKISTKTAYLIWKNPYMAAGKPTFIDHILELLHFENIFTERDGRYPVIDWQNPSQKPQQILLSSEPYPFKDKDLEELKKLGYQNIEIVNGEYYSWYGTRLIKALDYFLENYST